MEQEMTDIHENQQFIIT